MNNLLYNIANSDGYYTNIITLLFGLSIIFSIFVITVKNPIISVLFLIALFFTMASYLIIVGISFIGLSYLLVYVGAISMLFLFILMLINIRVSELTNETKNSVPLIFIIAIIFESISYIILQKSLFYDSLLISRFNDLNIVVFLNWETKLADFNHINTIGGIMYSNLAIWLLLTSLILLLAMIGAIVITIKYHQLHFELLDYNQVNIKSKINFTSKATLHMIIKIVKSVFASIFKYKFLRITVIGIIVYGIRYILLHGFGLYITECLDYLGFTFVTLYLETFFEPFFLKPMLCQPHGEDGSDTSSSSGDSDASYRSSASDKRDDKIEKNYKEVMWPIMGNTEEIVAKATQQYWEASENLERFRLNQTEDSNGEPLKDIKGIATDILMAQEKLMFTSANDQPRHPETEYLEYIVHDHGEFMAKKSAAGKRHFDETASENNLDFISDSGQNDADLKQDDAYVDLEEYNATQEQYNADLRQDNPDWQQYNANWEQNDPDLEQYDEDWEQDEGDWEQDDADWEQNDSDYLENNNRNRRNSI